MNPVTTKDRQRELERLTAQIRQQPNRDWGEERHRIGVLATQLAAAGRSAHD